MRRSCVTGAVWEGGGGDSFGGEVFSLEGVEG